MSILGVNYSNYPFWNTYSNTWQPEVSSIVHIGSNAGATGQNQNAVAIGNQAGQYNQNQNAISIGANAGNTFQGTNAIAIGYNAGFYSQGSNAIAIGNNAGYTQQITNSIIINANNSILNSVSSGLFVNPIRFDNNTTNSLLYNTSTKEITYSNPGIITVNQGVYGEINKMSSINYQNPVTIKSNGIVSKINNYISNGQIYTFGAFKNPMWIALGSGTNTIAFSTNGTTWTGLGTAIFSTAGNDVCWSGNLFVGVGQGTNTIAYSYNGIDWTGLGTTIFATAGVSIAYNYTLFVAAGNTTLYSLAYSYDGYLWNPIVNSIATVGSGSTINKIIWNGSQFYLATSATNKICYSSDGLSWTGIAITNMSTCTAFAWSGNIFVCAGFHSSLATSNTLLYSFDGKTWTASTSGITATKHFNVIWDGTKFVTFGILSTTNYIGYSYDGIVWVESTTTIPSVYTSFNGQLYLSGGSVLAYSFDGLNWTSLGSSIFSTTCNSLVFNNTRRNTVKFASNLVIASATNANFSIAYSTDDTTTWTGITNSNQIFSSGNFNGCIYNGNIYVGFGTGTYSIGYSFDGINWYGVNKTIFITAYQAIWDGTLFIAGGNGFYNSLAYSNNGLTWTGLGTSILTTCYSISYNSKIYVACGTGIYNFGYSYNGMTWSGQNITVSGRIVVWGASKFVLGGSSTYMMYSSNGITWYSTAAVFGTQCNTIVFKSNKFVAGGQGPSAGTSITLAYSLNGVNWTTVTSSNTFFNSVQSLVWYGSKFLAGGNSGSSALYSSVDGITWTSNTATTSIFSLNTAVNELFSNKIDNGYINIKHPIVSSVYNNYNHTLAYSNDGLTWQGLGATIFSSEAKTSCWNGSMWVAVGYGTNSIAYSYCGCFWTGLGTTIFSTGYGVACNSTYFVACGINSSNHVIAYSPNGINWTSINLTSLSQNFVFMYWNGSNFIASSNSNGSLMSSDGINWKNTNISSICSASNGKNTVMVGTKTSYINNQNVYVAVGGSTSDSINLYVSYDGITWYQNNTTTFSTTTNGATCVAYGNGQWLAGGNSTNLVYTNDITSPTSAWTTVNYNSNTSNVVDIIYGNGLWIVIYSNNSVSFSTNPSGFWSAQVALGFTANCLAYGFNGYIVGGTTTSAFSTYGRTWTTFSTLNAIIGTVKCITSSLTYWVAVGTPTGSYSSIAYCSDAGATWTGIATTILNFTTAVTVTFGNNNMFIAAGGTGTYNLAYAYNSSITVWTLININSMSPLSITCNYKYWIIGGTSTKNFAYSTDGINWTDNALLTPNNIPIRDITSMNFTYSESSSAGIVTPLSPIAQFNDLRNNYSLFILGTGQVFVFATPTPFTYQVYNSGIDQRCNFFYAGDGSSNVFIIQNRGKNLTTSSTAGVVGSLTMTTPTANNNQLFTFTLTSNGRYKIQDYYGFYINGGGFTQFLHATTFTEWVPTLFTNQLNCICWGQGPSNPLGTYVAGGFGNYPLIYSRDGINWTGVTPVEINKYGLSIVFVAASVTGATVYTSSNTISWTTLGSFPITTAIYSLYYCIQKFMYIACGSGGFSVAISYDGSSWTGSSSATTLTTANCVTYAPELDLFVVGGASGFLWCRGSTMVFTLVSTSGVNFNSICWSPELQLFVAATSVGIYVSTTGKTFTYTAQSTISFTSISWSGTLFIATGDVSPHNDKSYYSYNGINWTNNNLWSNFGRDNAVAYNGYIYVRIIYQSSDTTSYINYSYDGLIYNSTSVGGYYSVFWCGSYFLAYNQQTATGYAYSYDGIRWVSRGSSPNIRTITCNRNINNYYPLLTPYSVCWNGSQFIASGRITDSFGSSYPLATSKDGINWTDISSSVFNSMGPMNLSTVSNVEQVNQTSQLILDQYGTEETQQLDVMSDKYFQQGINNFNITIQHNTLK